MMKSRKPQLLIKENYLTFIRASVGSNLFRKLFYSINGRRVEILRDGDLSCAFFVSSILRMLGLIGEMHTTVQQTVLDMKRHGWKRIAKPQTGAVIVWGPKFFKKSGETHRHIGFYIDGGKAISNQSKKRSPGIHKWDYRPVEEILWNPALK